MSGRGGGTALPGKVLLALRPDGLRLLSRTRPRTTVCISATNGKTTVTAMLARVLESAGIAPVHNLAGANLRSGIASTLLGAGAGGTHAVLETDEAALPSVVADIEPSVIVLGNLFRDQLDRYGELESVAERWRDMLASLDPARTTLVANVDDPLISDLADGFAARAEGRPSVITFGCDDTSVAYPQGVSHAADAKACRRCGTPLEYTSAFLGHLGHFSCPGCGHSRATPQVSARAVRLDGLAASDVEIATPAGTIDVRLQIPGLYNVYNALAATAASLALQRTPAEIRSGLQRFSPAFGRFERVNVPRGGTLTFLLVKNPVGLNESVRTVVESGVDLSATMFALNDGIADGRDTSWIWDADVEPLLQAAPSLIVTGTRAAEFGLRAMYGGMPLDRMRQIDNLEDALDDVLARAREITTHGQAYAFVTYTAMLELHRIVRERGWVTAYWEPKRNGVPA